MITQKGIKFRAWDAKNKVMVYYEPTGEKSYTGDWISYFFQLDVMQFTGLYDKEGVEIYGGDLVIYVNQKQERIQEVVWLNKHRGELKCGFWGLKGQVDRAYMMDAALAFYEEKEIKVVGNIFEGS